MLIISGPSEHVQNLCGVCEKHHAHDAANLHGGMLRLGLSHDRRIQFRVSQVCSLGRLLCSA